MKFPDLNNRKNSTRIAVAMGVIFVVLILFNQLAQNPSYYAQRMQQIRAQIDLNLKNGIKSPIPPEARTKFKGLQYFPIDESYIVTAELLPRNPVDTFLMMTTTGEIDPFLELGKVRFTLREQVFELTAFQYLEKKANTLFIPFTDASSGQESYGGGRYLDVPLKTPLELDFNTAYNPYCVYNERFSCPIPPRENHLDIPIKVGERMYQPPS